MGKREGQYYFLSQEEKDAFQRDGFLRLKGIMSEEEMQQMEITMNQFINKQVSVGLDYSDFDVNKNDKQDGANGISVMLPSEYVQWDMAQVFKARAAHITQQLYGQGMMFDYDRVVAKKPYTPNAQFHWHQDARYCKSHGAVEGVLDERTATFSLAFDETNDQNGCIQFVKGSHKEKDLRHHVPIEGLETRANHSITKTVVNEKEEPIVSLYLNRGDASIHNERIVHGSKGNNSDHWRRNYMVAFRSEEMIQKMKEIQFFRSMNPDVVARKTQAIHV